LYRARRRLNTADRAGQMTAAQQRKKSVRIAGKRMTYVESAGGERAFRLGRGPLAATF